MRVLQNPLIICECADKYHMLPVEYTTTVDTWYGERIVDRITCNNFVQS